MKNRSLVRQAVRQALLTGCIATAVGHLPVAVAQEPGSDGAVEEIVVTGSRLKRARDLVAVSPVQTIDMNQIQASGNVTLEDTLNEYPQLTPDSTSTTAQSGGTGVLTADLRGLGPVRTLVLVDGRRFVPGNVTGLVDLATIPDMLVERVEIVTGGASAVYGSDAIAGAVNFILRDDFEGAEARYQWGESSRGDGGSNKIDLLIGANTGDGRGNVTLHGSYTKRDPVFFGDRDFSRVPTLADSTGALQVFGVGTIPGGLIGVPSTDFGLIQGVDLTNADGSCPGPIQGIRFGDGSVPAPFCRPVDQYNYAPPNFLLRPLERWQITATGHYEVADGIEAYSQLFYTSKENAYQMAPDAVSPTSFGEETGTLLIPNADTNPLFTQPLRDFFAANSSYFDPDSDGIFTVRNTAWQIEELGPRNVTTVTDGYNLTGGLRGDLQIGDSEWSWDTFYQFSRSDVTVIQANRLSRTRLTLGLDVEIVNGEVQCRIDLLNCVPVAIFGTDALTEEMAEFLKVTTGRQDQFTRQLAGATIAGDLFELPAGPVATAFGAEWRQEEFSTVPDETALSGDLGPATPPIVNNGDFDIFEVFGEARLPIVADLPAVQSLAFETAVRFSDYSTIGNITTWKGALDWQINDLARARVGLSRAIRAPNLDELYGAPSSGFTGGVDPCVVDNNPTAAQKELCIEQGVPPAIVDNLQVGASQGFQVLSGGNIGLGEEEADTFTAGIVFTPPRFPDFTLAIDYFEIEVSEAITQVSAQALVNSCFETLDADGAACQSISRLSSGNIERVDAPLLNVANRKVSGVDIQANYTFDLPDYLALPGGGATLDTTLVATNQFEDATVLLPGEPEIDCAGFYGGTCSSDAVRITPDFTAMLRAGYTSGNARLRAQLNYIGDLELHPNAFPNENGTLDPMVYFDLNGSYSFSDRVEVFAGVNNLFDKQPPVLGFRAGGDASTNVTLFDPIGRRYFLGARIGF